MAYRIKKYSFDRAKELGVKIEVSENPKKKIDVFDPKDGKKLASIGAAGMMDYPTWMEKMGKNFADQRRKLYKKRHEKDRHEKGTKGWYADQILW